MRVLLDNQAVAVEEPSFAAAIEAGRREAERRGRVVVEVHVDGRPAPEEWLDAPAGPDRRAAEINFVSAEPYSLVRVTLLEVAESLEQARHTQRQVAQLIQEDRLEEALGPLAEAVTVWTNVQQAVSSGAALLGLDIAALEHATGAQIGPMIDDLADRLRQIKAALTAEDWTTVADVVGYEMDERCTAWSEAIKRLCSSLDRARN